MRNRKKLRRFLAIILSVLMLLPFAGCSSKSKTLNVYILNWGNTETIVDEIKAFKEENPKMTVNLVEFDDNTAMDERLEEELADGKGPDIIISTLYCGLDMLSLAGNGTFYDMTKIIADDKGFTEEDYFTPVMKAGQLDGKQYIIPLSFTLPVFVSSRKTLEEAGINWDYEDTSVVYEQLLTYLESDDNAQISGGGIGYYDTLMSLMLSAGEDLWSYDDGQILLDERTDETVTKLAFDMYWQDVQWLEDHPYTITASDIAQLPILYNNLLIAPNMIRYLYSAYEQEGLGNDFRMYIPTASDGRYRALVQEFAAVTPNCKNPEAAWSLLRKIMDRDQSYNYWDSVTMNRKKVSEHMLDLIQKEGRKSGDVQIVPLPEDYAIQLEMAYKNITDAVLYQYSPIFKTLMRKMQSYAYGEFDYAEMITDFKQEMDQYFSE